MDIEALIIELRARFPNGHPMFIDLAVSEMGLHSRKNRDFARGGHPLGNFKRCSKIFELYPELDFSDQTVVAMAYMLKQFDAVMWMLNKHYEGEVEDVGERLRDIAVYAKIAYLCHVEPDSDERKESGSSLSYLLESLRDDERDF